MRTADVDDGVRPGSSAAEVEELRALKRRNRLLEQETEVLRRAGVLNAQRAAPERRTRWSSTWPADGITVAVHCFVLGFS